MAEKAVNYTAEQTAKIIADYQAGVKVEDIAQAMGTAAYKRVAATMSWDVFVKAFEYYMNLTASKSLN